MGSSEEKYLKSNQELWNAKTDVHFHSTFYDVKAFINGKSGLNPLELHEVGDVRGKQLLHLQCHFGMDTLSWARCGAEVTGIDFSEQAILRARQLADQVQQSARFIHTNIYDLPLVLDDQFDIVFTSYGVLGWLPDLRRWGELVARYLKPGGFFYIVEFHPIVWMFDDDFRVIEYPYNSSGVMTFDEEGTYADREASIGGKSYNWNHSISEVVNALIGQRLRIDFFREHYYSPYNIFPRPVQKNDNLWAIEGLDGKIPMLYSLKAVKSPGKEFGAADSMKK